jgi:hypothetical protein
VLGLTTLTVQLVQIDDRFVCQLFELIEELSNDVNDPYHYPIIRVLVCSLFPNFSPPTLLNAL